MFPWHLLWVSWIPVFLLKNETLSHHAVVKTKGSMCDGSETLLEAMLSFIIPEEGTSGILIDHGCVSEKSIVQLTAGLQRKTAGERKWFQIFSL